jgi:tRNA A-37 threonylcarbamoyl transferase component Bud32
VNTLFHAREPGAGSPASPSESGVARLRKVLADATLGDLEILGVIGRGGMATVFLGYELALDRHVAIKVMAPSLLLQEGMAERFRREARIAAGLSHPNIIPVYSVRQTEDLLYFVMKYVDGCSLERLIQEHPALPPAMARRILFQVAGALGYAHRRGVVHRDVKPANIMVDADGEVMVADFGIARAEWMPGLTATGASVGTPYYMSPEQCVRGGMSGHSDQYSLGIVGYQMLTGRLPFHGADAGEIMRAHLTDHPPDLRALQPDCPADLAMVVMRMLAKRPEERWPGMDAIVEAMERDVVASGPVRDSLATLVVTAPGRTPLPRSPVSPVPMTRTPGAHRAGKRNRRTRLLPGAILGLLVAGTAYLVSSITPRGPTGEVIGRPQEDRTSPLPSQDEAGHVGGTADAEAGTVAGNERASGVVVRQPDAPGGTATSRGTRAPPMPSREASGPRPEPRVPSQVPSASVQGGDTIVAARWGWIRLGTRREEAFLYINGTPQLPKGPSLRWWRVPVGDVTLSFHMEGCVPWEETRRVAPGDSIQIGYRFPSCPP